MRGISLLCSLLLAACVVATDTTQSVRQAFIQSGLVPDVLSSFDPCVLLDVTYTIPGTGQQKAVSPPGLNFTMPQTLNSPTFSIPSGFERFTEEKLVVAMVDPDAPTPQNPTAAQVRHYLGGDFRIQTVNGVGLLFNDTPALSEYRQPAPPNTSDPHRYTWLLYLQSSDFPTNISANILNFNISEFALQFGLGQPLAGNYMTVSTNPEALAAAGES